MPASETFTSQNAGLESPAFDGVAVTPSDSTDLTNICRALYIGVTGDVAVITKGGTTLTFKNAQQGSIIPVRCSRVRSTNTTASSIIALY